jgi:hypothetical protein
MAVQLAEGFHEHPKLRQLYRKGGRSAWGAWLLGLAYADKNRTAYIPLDIAQQLARDDFDTLTDPEIGLWEPRLDCVVIHDWYDWQGEITGLEDKVNRCLDYWLTFHPGSRRTESRKAKVRSRLREGYTVEDICQGIDGSIKAPFINEHGVKKDDLVLICHTGPKLEDFMARVTAKPHVDRLRRDDPIAFANRFEKYYQAAK